MKVSVSEYFRKVFRKIVSGYDNLTNLLPMNMVSPLTISKNTTRIFNIQWENPTE